MIEISHINGFANTLGGLSSGALVVVVILAGFGLAAYAIGAVERVCKQPVRKAGRNGND